MLKKLIFLECLVNGVDRPVILANKVLLQEINKNLHFWRHEPLVWMNGVDCGSCWVRRVAFENSG